MTLNIKKIISIESFQGKNWVRTMLSQKHAQAILRAAALKTCADGYQQELVFILKYC